MKWNKEIVKENLERDCHTYVPFAPPLCVKQGNNLNCCMGSGHPYVCQLFMYIFSLPLILSLCGEKNRFATEERNQLYFMPNFPNRIFSQWITTSPAHILLKPLLAEAVLCTTCAENTIQSDSAQNRHAMWMCLDVPCASHIMQTATRKWDLRVSERCGLRSGKVTLRHYPRKNEFCTTLNTFSTKFLSSNL